MITTFVPSQLTKAQQATVDQVKTVQSQFQNVSESELRHRVEDLREAVFKPSADQDKIIESTLALSREAIRRVLGMNLYDVQILAANALIHRRVAQMQTGEGKTVSAAPAAVYGGILCGGTHVATPNSYLAERDYEQLRPVFELLGLSVGLLKTDQPAEKNDVYACDITYGPGYEFGFDYLRDQLILKQRASEAPGTNLLNTLRGREEIMPTQTRGLNYSVIDEIDNVLVDDASSPQVLSEFQPGTASDAEAVQLAQRLAATLSSEIHFIEPSPNHIRLTDTGIQFVHDSDLPIPVEQLLRPWTKYVEAALRARHLFHLNIHYILDNEEVKIVDESTGRIFEDRSWQAGLHQAIQAKESVTITPESLPLAQITRQRFYRLYKHLSGMTGTAEACKAELNSIYRLEICTIPLRAPSRRILMPWRVFDSADRKWEAIADSVLDIQRTGRPVLIGTRTIHESLVVADYLSRRNVDFDLLNGRQDADEADVVSHAGAPGSITIATNLAGRGTDIKLTDEVRNLGGLHVIVTECHASVRIDRQLVGRCARQGDPGSAQTFASADDWLLKTHGPWLAKSIRQISVNGEVNLNLEQKFRAIQMTIERQEFAQRMDLMRSSEEQNKILQRAY